MQHPHASACREAHSDVDGTARRFYAPAVEDHIFTQYCLRKLRSDASDAGALGLWACGRVSIDLAVQCVAC